MPFGNMTETHQMLGLCFEVIELLVNLLFGRLWDGRCTTSDLHFSVDLKNHFGDYLSLKTLRIRAGRGRCDLVKTFLFQQMLDTQLPSPHSL